MVSEQTFQVWARAPSETEQTKCDNAVNVIRKALDASALLSRRRLRVFAQGSYCNRTNVRQDSDVDICALYSDTIFYDLPVGMFPANFNLTDVTYPYSQFKNEVSAALSSYFTQAHVVRGNKAIDIKENTYRLAADVVPCFVYKDFTPNGMFREGVGFVSDASLRIINWPDQNYANGVTKNTATGQRFKAMVRILKRLCYAMKDENIPAAGPIPSFLVECLVYYVPDETFQLDPYASAEVFVRTSHIYVSASSKLAPTFRVRSVRDLLRQDLRDLSPSPRNRN